jgi:hypothetical protein
MNRYTFYIRTADTPFTSGETTEWTGLSHKRARDMHAYTSAHQPSNVTSHGWFEEKSPIKFDDLTNVSEGAEV